jgi:hypothetical protein
MAYKYKSRVRIKFTLKQLKILSIILFLFFLIVLIYHFWPKPIYVVNYKGVNLGFRADLREAQKIPVYPDENILKRAIIHPLVQNVTIAFVPVEGENGIYVVESWEIVNKLHLAYQQINSKPGFNGMEIESYENIELKGKIQNPIIVLVHPRYANETSVRLKYHTVFISGKSNYELDLATIKFLMVALGIKV